MLPPVLVNWQQFAWISTVEASISYNGLTSFFLFSAIGIIFYSSSSKYPVVFLFLAGMLLAFGFFCKCTSTVALFPLLCAVILMDHETRKLWSLTSLVGGIAAGCTAFWGTLQPLGSWYSQLTLSLFWSRKGRIALDTLRLIIYAVRLSIFRYWCSSVSPQGLARWRS